MLLLKERRTASASSSVRIFKLNGSVRFLANYVWLVVIGFGFFPISALLLLLLLFIM